MRHFYARRCPWGFLCKSPLGARISQLMPGHRFEADSLAAGWAGQPEEQQPDAQRQPDASGRWGSALSLLLFGPLALGREREPTKPTKLSMDSIWSSWCFYDRSKLTEEGIMPDEAALRQAVLAASWQPHGEASELLSTDATWRLPDLALGSVACSSNVALRLARSTSCVAV